MAKSNEPFWWSLFSAGGMVAAMVLPILIIITGILVPFGLAGDDPLNFERINTAVSHPLIKLVFFAVISLPLFHWAHRFRYTIYDLFQVKHGAQQPIALLCYGAALLGTIIAAYTLLTIG